MSRNWNSAPRAPRIMPVHRRNYEHMETLVQPVREVCPKTGDYIDPKPIDWKLVVKRHLMKDKSLVDSLRELKDKGIENLTEADYKKAYKIIKGFNACNRNIQLST